MEGLCVLVQIGVVESGITTRRKKRSSIRTSLSVQSRAALGVLGVHREDWQREGGRMMRSMQLAAGAGIQTWLAEVEQSGEPWRAMARWEAEIEVGSHPARPDQLLPPTIQGPSFSHLHQIMRRLLPALIGITQNLSIDSEFRSKIVIAIASSTPPPS